jgi:hypothetical protein
MDVQPIINDITGGTPQPQPKSFEVKPQWLLRRAAYLRANAIHQQGTVGRVGRRARRRGLFRLRRGAKHAPRP